MLSRLARKTFSPAEFLDLQLHLSVLSNEHFASFMSIHLRNILSLLLDKVGDEEPPVEIPEILFRYVNPGLIP